MALNQTVTNAQVLVMPEMKYDRPEAQHVRISFQ